MAELLFRLELALFPRSTKRLTPLKKRLGGVLKAHTAYGDAAAQRVQYRRRDPLEAAKNVAVGHRRTLAAPENFALE